MSGTEEAPDHVPVRKRLVVINAASSVGARILNITVLLWMYQYLLERIPPEEFAVYPVMTALMVFAPLFFSFFTSGVSRYVVEAYARGEFERVTATVSSILPPLGLAASVFVAAGLLLATHVDRVFNIAPGMVEEARLMLALLVVSYATQMATLPLGVGFHVRQRYVELNLLQILRDLFRIVLLVTLLVGVGPSVLWVVVATVVAEQLHVAAAIWRSRRLVPELRLVRRLVDWTLARSLFTFGLWTTLGQLANVMYTNAATLILNGYGTALDVTNYHLGATFFRQTQAMIGLAAQPLQPVLTAMHAREEPERLGRTALRGGRYGLWVAMIVACPTAIYAHDLVHLYLGETYSDAGWVLILFALIFPFSQPAVLLPMVAMATAQVRPFNIAALVSTFAGLVVMVALAGGFGLGAIGVTLSLTLVTAIAQVGYFWRLQQRLAHVSAAEFWSETLKPGLLPAVAGATVWAAAAAVNPPVGWWALVFNAMAGAAVYVVVLFGFCLDCPERGALRTLRSRLRGRVG